MNKNMLAVALASLLVGGVAVAAYQSFSGESSTGAGFADGDRSSLTAGFDGDAAADGRIPGADYADVVKVDPVLENKEMFASVIGTDPVNETNTTTTPRQICEDRVVQERAPERDGNVGGTVAGAVIGGLVGNQVGGGNGKKAATAAGAVAGGFIGNRVDRNHVGGRVTQRVDTQCRTVSDTSKSSKVVGYNVTYRNPDGTTGTMRVGEKPGDRISLGPQEQVVGYDVTYRYDGREDTVRLDQRPEGDRLPVVDGKVAPRMIAASDAGPDRG